MEKYLPFTTSLLGSMPRSKKIMQYRRKAQSGEILADELDSLVAEETLKIVEMQKRCNVDIITNGELSRDNYVSFVSDKLKGVTMMNMGDMLEYIEDKKAFEQILEILDVPAVSIKNAICTGKVALTGASVIFLLLGILPRREVVKGKWNTIRNLLQMKWQN